MNQRHSTRLHPAIWLVYLAFFAMGPVIAGRPDELLRTAVALALFVPTYLWTSRQSSWRALPALLGITGLALYFSSTNLGATVFFIYAAALAIRLGSPRRAYGWLGCLLLVQALATWNLSDAIFYLAPMLIWSAMIGLICIHQETIDRKNDELRQSREEVTRLAKIAERERIARDLHDLLGHTLSLVVLKSQLAGRLLARGDARAGAEIAAVEKVARQALQEVRTAIAGFKSAGLPAEIAAAANACEAAGLRFERPAGLDEEAAALPPLVEGAMAMALREAITNVLRHAEATTCRVRFAAEPRSFRLEIEDDGRGPAGRDFLAGHGMSHIRERVAQLGGEARWLSVPGGGTLLRLELPRQDGAGFEALDRSPGQTRIEAA